jgi:hypothetical protein
VSAARSSSGRRPSAGRRPGPGGRAPSRPGGRPQGGPGSSAGRPAPDRVRPLLPGEARGALASLLLFAVGFAVAGVLVAAGLGSTPGYYIAISLGLVGIGALGFFSRRTPAEAPPPPVWSPRGLTRIAHGAGVPARLVVISFYALLAISVLGNLVVPLLTRR